MDCLFCQIANGKIPATIVYEDETLICFKDINPAAPAHILLIPREHIATINDGKAEHEQLFGKMILKARDLAKQEQLADAGYRLVFNVNPGGGQAVYHIHLHLLGGRQMTWPPG